MKMFAFISALLFVGMAHAAEISTEIIQTSGGPEKYILISGNIVEADINSFYKVRSSNPDATGVWLDSLGGEVPAGVTLAMMIYDDNLNTAVDHYCTSICSVMFLAGDNKFATPEAYIGVHSAYIVEGDKKIRSDAANAGVLYVFGYMRYPPELAALWVNTDPEKLTVIDNTLSEKLHLGIQIMNLN